MGDLDRFTQAMVAGLFSANGMFGSAPFARGVRRLPSPDSDDSRSSGSSIRSRSRGPRRVPGFQSGRETGLTVLDFGRHEGRTYQEVASQEPGYVRWALSVRRPQRHLAVFQRWLRSGGTASADSGDLSDISLLDVSDSGDDRDARSGHTGGNAVAVEPRPRVPSSEMQTLLNGLPRIAFSTGIFSGDPHPVACPICMDDFGPSARPAPSGAASGGLTNDGEAAAGGELPAGTASQPREGGAELEIVLTPCLHVFHVGCLTNWLARPSAARACPTCRWDIGDDGASRALGAARQCPQPDLSRPQTIRDLVAVDGDSPVVDITSDSESN